MSENNLEASVALRKFPSVVALLLPLVVASGYAASASVSFLGPTNYPVGTHPVTVAVGDFNRDGHLDLAVANGGSGDVSILLGNGDGTFQQARNISVGPNPLAIAVGDFNHDGKDDLVIILFDQTDSNGSVTVLLGNGDGTFQLVWQVSENNTYPSVVAVGDFDGDGRQDLAVGLNNPIQVTVLLGNGDGTFQSGAGRTTQFPVNFFFPLNSVAVGDLNGDHIPDLVLATGGIFGPDNLESKGAVSILLGNGDGTFQSPVNYGDPKERITAVALGDLNGDGKLDVAAAASDFDHPEFFPIKTFEASEKLLFGNGDGTFQQALTLDSTSEASALFLAAGDLKGDGKVDLAALDQVAGASASSLIVLQNNGDGSFQTAGFDGETAVSLAEADLNHDGALDLILVNAGDNTIGVLLNSNGTPSFTLSVTASTNGGSGTILGSPGGINCPISDCSVVFAAGVAVALTAEASTGSIFAGWSGACAGTGSCTVVMNSDQSVTATFNATAPPDFSLTASTLSPSTVTAGQLANGTVTVTPIGGFNGAVAFSCSVQPPPSHAPTCAVAPSGSGALVTVMTTTPSFARTIAGSSAWLFALWLPLIGVITTNPRSLLQRKKIFFSFCFCSVLLCAAGFQLACGGNGSIQVKQLNSGTPSGNYTIIVTGTSGALQHSANFTLTVE